MAFRELSNIPGTQGSPLEENGHTQQCLDATDSLFFRASAAQVWGNSRTRRAKQPYHYYFSTSLSQNPKESLIYPHPNHSQNAKRRGGTSNRLSTGTTPVPGVWSTKTLAPGCGKPGSSRISHLALPCRSRCSPGYRTLLLLPQGPR